MPAAGLSRGIGGGADEFRYPGDAARARSRAARKEEEEDGDARMDGVLHDGRGKAIRWPPV
jgi:hypothetical protein